MLCTSQRDKKLDSLVEKDITYSYNLYVVLDQLSRINSKAKCGEVEVRLTPEELKGLKDMVDKNDEDLLIYFEEYVEKSGPVYIENGQAWKSFLRFGKMAKYLFALNASTGKAKKKDTDAGDDEEEEDGEEEEEDGEGGEGGEGDGKSSRLRVC